MKYIIIGRDDSNGNEYVRAEAPATAAQAVELCERLNKNGYNEHTSYRIENISETVREEILERLRNEPSFKMFTGTPEVGHIRSEDFTPAELFGKSFDADLAAGKTLTCSECWCASKNPYKHTVWHNKLLS